ncbi:S-methyl-5-thioribose kinase [Fictibacillus aquaticus]|uniref:Methylthioribose kinase n=1 Tax=Fictibacillus aquaticus TaxID=2021314 RepID=A0A235FCK2_9BACL|nr:S-methyl-5-thioribose kinase [Fictibacillus aquaticus]OYD59110.1 S-methyl-5-thioribose kinase [Fictibacillus aquaticus]
MTTAAKAEYKALTNEEAEALVKNLGLISETELSVSEIGDGNLNLVFKVTGVNESVIVKQALPYAKVVGESWPLTLDRARIESDALIHAAKYVPHLVPKVLYTDSILAVTIMEDLSSHTIARKGLIESNAYALLARDIGIFAARTAFYTSDFYLHPFEKKRLVQSFSNPELCKITEDLVFTDPFFDHETNDFPEELRPDVEQLWSDAELCREAGLLKYQFLTQAEVLLHGDLHTGSIFVKEDSTKVIDPEFAFFGPLGFDIGQFIANIALNYLSQHHHSQEPFNRKETQDKLLKTIEETWKTFENEFSRLFREESTEPFAGTDGVLENLLEKTFTDAIGFAGCEIIRRTIGLAHVADLDSISCSDVQHYLKRKALKLGASLIKTRSSVTTIEQFTSRVRGA